MCQERREDIQLADAIQYLAKGLYGRRCGAQNATPDCMEALAMAYKLLTTGPFEDKSLDSPHGDHVGTQPPSGNAAKRYIVARVWRCVALYALGRGDEGMQCLVTAGMTARRWIHLAEVREYADSVKAVWLLVGSDPPTMAQVLSTVMRGYCMIVTPSGDIPPVGIALAFAASRPWADGVARLLHHPLWKVVITLSSTFWQTGYEDRDDIVHDDWWENEKAIGKPSREAIEFFSKRPHTFANNLWFAAAQRSPR